MKVEPSAPLFDWIKMNDVGAGDPHQDTVDFNERFDTPKPTKVSSDKPPVDPKFMNTHGGISDTAIPSVKFYKNKAGDKKQVAQPVEKK
jgi:hypothetical protein